MGDSVKKAAKRERKMITLKEIARECNVSPTTVSNILNGKPKVSQETKERVLETVNRLGYRPNYIAQGLRNQKNITFHRSRCNHMCLPSTAVS